MVKMNVNEAQLQDAQRREKDILAQRDQIAERAREAERGLSEKYIRLRSEYAAAQGALDSARRRCEELEAALARRAAAEAQKVATAGNIDDEAKLRQSISEIGTALIRLMRQPNGDGAAGSNGLRLPTATLPSALRKADATTEPQPADHEAVTS